MSRWKSNETSKHIDVLLYSKHVCRIYDDLCICSLILSRFFSSFSFSRCFLFFLPCLLRCWTRRKVYLKLHSSKKTHDAFFFLPAAFFLCFSLLFFASLVSCYVWRVGGGTDREREKKRRLMNIQGQTRQRMKILLSSSSFSLHVGPSVSIPFSFLFVSFQNKKSSHRWVNT